MGTLRFIHPATERNYVGWVKEQRDDGQDSPSVAEHMDVRE
jgi:hypothetical protein